MNTNELTKIEELKIENSKLNERLNNCAKQFKQMMNTIEELQHKVSELEAKVNQTSNEDKTSTNQDSSTSSNSTSTNETSTKQEKSDLKPSNPSSGTTTHQEEEKPTEGKEMPLNENKLRYLDTMTDKQYATKQEAQKDGVNPRFLYDFKIGCCLWSYEDEDDASIDNTSNVQEKTSTIEENPSSGITTHQEEEKPTESVSVPSTAIVENDANQEKEGKAVEKKHMYFKEVTTLNDEIINDLKKNYPTSEWPKLFKIDWANNTIQSKTSRDILGYGEESKELRDMIAMDSNEGKRLMKMVGVGV